MPNYHIWTIGCQMNKAESERLASLFEETGYQAVNDVAEADLIVVNTCVVRQNAEERAINKLANFKPLKKARPDLILAVTGCWVDSNVERLKSEFPYVDYFFKAGDCPPWVDKIQWSAALPKQPQPTTYVPIIQGCNHFCAYCVVPYPRGREKSRAFWRIVGASTIAHDITARKRTEKTLREYERMVEGLEEMIVVVDREYRYVIANRAFLQLSVHGAGTGHRPPRRGSGDERGL